MAQINSNDLREGMVFDLEGQTFIVMKYQHIKKARGQATIRVKVKNIKTGSITEKTFTNEQKVDEADVEKKSAQYLYKDDEKAYFMDTNDYSQFSFISEDIDWEVQFLKEGEKVVTLFLKGVPISIQIPKSVDLKIKNTSDAVSGNTSTSATKEAVLETGYKIQVPLFIQKGEKIKVNTDSGEYSGRA